MAYGAVLAAGASAVLEPDWVLLLGWLTGAGIAVSADACVALQLVSVWRGKS